MKERMDRNLMDGFKIVKRTGIFQSDEFFSDKIFLDRRTWKQTGSGRSSHPTVFNERIFKFRVYSHSNVGGNRPGSGGPNQKEFVFPTENGEFNKNRFVS